MSDPDKPEPLDQLLAQISRLHYIRAHELLGHLGLYRGQPPVLYALWDKDGLTHSELAQKLKVTPATITRMIQRMEKTGFVIRRPDANDQRVSRVYLTEAGIGVRATLQAVWEQLEAENFAEFSPEEQIVMRAYLLKIRANLLKVTGEKFNY